MSNKCLVQENENNIFKDFCTCNNCQVEIFVETMIMKSLKRTIREPWKELPINKYE